MRCCKRQWGGSLGCVLINNSNRQFIPFYLRHSILKFVANTILIKFFIHGDIEKQCKAIYMELVENLNSIRKYLHVLLNEMDIEEMDIIAKTFMAEQDNIKGQSIVISVNMRTAVKHLWLMKNFHLLILLFMRKWTNLIKDEAFRGLMKCF